MTFSVHTHDSWGVVPIGDYTSLEEARKVFGALREDSWYRQDGTVKGIELVEHSPQGARQRIDWFAFREEGG
jgi:hypothetical protein